MISIYFFTSYELRMYICAFFDKASEIKKMYCIFQDLQTFLDESPDGVVYFSMGSLVRSESFSPDRLKALIDAFASLKARVLWKINPETLPKLPKNVKAMGWIPQVDVLSMT